VDKVFRVNIFNAANLHTNINIFYVKLAARIIIIAIPLQL